MSSSTEQSVEQAEQEAAKAVANTDTTVAEQATGYASSTPEQAEQAATEAVVNAVSHEPQGEDNTPEQAGKSASEAVAATEQG